jgi:long-chain fatty acid transport protein
MQAILQTGQSSESLNSGAANVRSLLSSEEKVSVFGGGIGKMYAVGRSLVLGALLALLPGIAYGQGLILPGSGASHRSMGGASTARAVDALGALYWNPATISGLPSSEVVIGGEALIGDTHLSSTIPAGAFGPLGPATTLSGTARSDSGVGLASGIGVVYRPDDSPLSYGVGLATLAAGGVNFRGDANNPVLAPTGPLNQFILGPQAASAAIVSIMPTASYQVTDRLAFGLSPMLDVSVVSFDPAFFGPTSQAGPLQPAQFPTGSHTRPFWGGGFRVGATYQVREALSTGVSFTSPQWFETWRFSARDANGNAIEFRTQFTLPMILSAGVAYSGIENLLLAADVRWFDYRTTQLLGEPVAQGGANWDSIWAAAVGSRYQVNERVAVSLGYIFNENPVPANLALFNTMLPALTQHTISAGVHYQMNDYLGMSMGYVHGFQNSITGSITPLVGTSTTLDTEYDSITFGLHIKFGPRRCADRSCTPSAMATEGACVPAPRSQAHAAAPGTNLIAP